MQEHGQDACSGAFGCDTVSVIKESIPGSWTGVPADRIAVKRLYAKYWPTVIRTGLHLFFFFFKLQHKGGYLLNPGAKET